jgi:uncharacterized protein (TIGR02099 family)
MEKFFKKIFKYLLIFALTTLVFLAAAISLARYFMPSLEQYERQITERIAKELQLDVHFGTFAGDWYRLGPALKVTDIVLSTHDGHIVAEIDALYISINLLTSIAKQQLVPAYMNVIGLQMDLEQQADKQITIANLPTADAGYTDHHLLIDMLKKYNRITLRRSQINFKDAEGIETPIYLRRLVLRRMGQNHQLDVMLNLLNHPTRLELVTQINGDLAVPEKLAVNGYVKVDDVVLDGYLKPYAYKDYAVQDGVVDLHAWFDWRENGLQSLQAQMNLHQVHIYAKQQDVVLKPFDLEGEFLWKKEGVDAWSLSSTDLRLGIDDTEILPLTSSFKLKEHGNAYEFVANKIMIDPVVRAMLWSEQLPKPQHELLTGLMPTGDLEDVKLNWEGSQWELGVRTHNLSFHSMNDMPGIKNLSATLMANPKVATLHLSSVDTYLDYPSIFVQPLFFNKIKGDINGQYDGHQWQIKSDDLVWVNHELNIDTQFTLKGSDTTDTFIDAALNIPKLNTLNLYHNLPVGALSTDLAHWLKTSMGPGQLEHINFTTNGPVKDFPYYDLGGGSTRLALEFDDLNLMFDPEWPMIEQAKGQFLFAGRHIDIVLDKASIFQTDLLGVSAEISLPETGTSWLNLHGETLLSMTHAVDFIDVTPLGNTLGKNLDAFTFNVPITLTLDLKVPLDNEKETTKVNGVAQVSEGDATIKELQLQFTNIHGVFGFTENYIFSSGINTELLGNPAVLTMTTEIKNGHHLTHWQLNGRAKMTDIATYYPSGIWDYIKGESDFVASFVIDNDTSEKGFDLSIASELNGTEITVPAPLGKAANELVPLRYTTSIGKPNDMKRIEYAQLIDGVAHFKDKNGKSEFTGAKIQLGSPLKNLETEQGIVVTGSLPKFSYDTWEDFIEAANSDTSTEHEEPVYDNALAYIKSVDVTFNEFDAFHFPFTKAQLHLTQANQKWLIKINSTELKGRISIPQTSQAGIINFDLDYCNWNDTQHYEEQNDLDPHHLVALSFSCTNFIFNQKSLGTIKFDIAPDAKGVKINNLSMTRPNDKFTANGHWWVENNVQNSSFTGHLSSGALDQTLALFDIKSTILGSKSETDFTLSWPSDPFDFDLANLNGQLDVRLRDGRLVDVNPGFGRILSLLSIQAIGRRLRLDFSDVFKKGFSFDEITAHVNIKKGIAHSDDLTMSAPAADMTMKGNVNLGTKQLDLLATVRVNITSSLPIAATIASGGNPIVGAVGVGVWAVDKIVKSQAGSLISSSYHVTGTWENPVVNGK